MSRRKGPERPNYGELDVGVVKQLSASDKECKKTQNQYLQAKCRLAHMQAEEAKMNVRLKKASLLQQAFENKRAMVEVRECDRRRKEELASRVRTDKEEMRNVERDRKERARDKMEDLYVSRRNDIMREREDWAKMKMQFQQETQLYQEKLSGINREDKQSKNERRQRLQDEIDVRLVSRTEERANERRRNEDLMRQRREIEQRCRSEVAKGQREAARGVQQTHFENMVRDKKSTVLADAGRKLATRKAACTEISREIQQIEREESKIRQRLDLQRQMLQEVSTPTYAAPTPRMVR